MPDLGPLLVVESSPVVAVVFAVNVYIHRFLGVNDEPVPWMDGRPGIQSIPNDERGQGHTESLGNGGEVVTLFTKKIRSCWFEDHCLMRVQYRA